MTREEAIEVIKAKADYLESDKRFRAAVETIIPELKESEDERVRKWLVDYFSTIKEMIWIHRDITCEQILTYLEKQKENPKSADSIPSDYTSDVKCEDRWHKVTDSLPDNGRLVLAKDCLGNVLLARYDGENWEVNVYDNEDHYCHNSISKWCEIPSEKQKEQKPAEWSEEDEKIAYFVNQFLEYHENADPTAKSCKKWFNNRLKSLRPFWKPSEDEESKNSK